MILNDVNDPLVVTDFVDVKVWANPAYFFYQFTNLELMNEGLKSLDRTIQMHKELHSQINLAELIKIIDSACSVDDAKEKIQNEMGFSKYTIDRIFNINLSQTSILISSSDKTIKKLLLFKEFMEEYVERYKEQFSEELEINKKHSDKK